MTDLQILLIVVAASSPSLAGYLALCDRVRR